MKRYQWLRVILSVLLLASPLYSVLGHADSYKWSKFVQVEGQPEPVPEEWVATPEGRFAHSLKIPNPVPNDSGYRWTMSANEYFEHLCKTEAGEFIFRKVENVEGFYFARPSHRPTDDELMSRYRLEAPEIQRTYQLMRATPTGRATTFVNPPWAQYRFVEEKLSTNSTMIRLEGYVAQKSAMKSSEISALRSDYGFTWRGLIRRADRENAIAGSEWLVYSIATNEILAVFRDYAISGRTRNVKGGVWWLNARNCIKDSHIDSRRFYRMVSQVLRPVEE